MNNKILCGVCCICLLAAWGGCTQEPLPGGATKNDGDNVTVRFAASIPGYKTVTTRADATVSGMWLLVFDENGNLIARREASLSNQTPDGGTFTVSLPASGTPRTVHFITNYNWTGFDDAAMLGANEAEIVAKMSTTDAAFWTRVELSAGISDTSFQNTTVFLLRNRAKVTVINNDGNFDMQGFTVHNRPDRGTVAPYDVDSGTFQEGTITEPQGMNIVAAEENEISAEDIYLFERENASETNITAVIMQGEFEGNSYFYKIDLIDADKNRYDIERNYHYAVTIRSVNKAGYMHFNDALNGASHNNTALDPIIEKYPIISDGTAKLEVEKTLVVLTQPGQQLQVWAKYFPDVNSAVVDNSGVTVALQPGNTALDGGSLSFDPSTGIITANALGGALPTPLGEARITVTQGDLARVIRVQLRQPFSFLPFTLNNNNPTTLTSADNSVMKFTIPADVPADLFPMEIKINTNHLFASTAGSGMELHTEGSNIYYMYKATGTGVQTLNFKPNHPNVSETITLGNEVFENASLNLTVSSIPVITISGTIQYYLYWGWWDVSSGSSVSVNAGGGTVTVNPSGQYTLTLPGTTLDNVPITFSYYSYTQTKTLSELRSNPDLRLKN